MTKVLDVKGLYVDLTLPAGVLHAVQNVSFHVEKGETFCLVGESGCGKTMTALAVMGLLPPSAKRHAELIQFEEEEITDADDARMTTIRGARMTMIFQEPMTSLDPCYTIGDQLEEVLIEHRKVNRQEARQRAVFLLEKVGITAATSRLKQYPHQLSGGLRQRVMIAMSLMCGPSLIIADEPTTALDVTIQAQILSLLVSVQKEYATGMILITHDLGVVARTANRLAVMYCGQTVETGTVKEVFQRPLHPYTRGLMKCIPVPGKTRPGQKLETIPGMVPTPIGELHGCLFRNRCAYAHRECAELHIEETYLSPGRSYRCLLDPDDLIKGKAS
ncbi:MAG: ABC transporter ATP-binding protein [Deltaproteobacteria bacterium]|nr:MAG: ABC transporter ATP-binding protein [Deltaproteobacteria bacterium]